MGKMGLFADFKTSCQYYNKLVGAKNDTSGMNPN